MEKINIEINQAKLLSYQVTLEDNKPEVTASVGLFAGNKQISTFQVTTVGFYSGIKFELSPEIIQPIVDIAKILETVTIRECRKALNELPAPEPDQC